MKKIILFCFLVFSTLLFAQGRTITGIIKDKNTQEPIDGVSVSIIGSNIGTVCNNEGAFRITVPEGYNKLSFSHLSYALKEYEVKDNATVELFLNPKEYQLNEVVIKQTPTLALLNEISVTSMEKLLNTNLLNTYYREFVKEDGKYIRFADGILEYYIKGSWKKRTMESKLEVKQSRVADFRDPKPLEDEDESRYFGGNDTRAVILKTYYLTYLLRNDTKHPIDDDYEYHVETKTETNGNSINIITITPKEGIEKPLFVTSVAYDPKTKLILDIDMRDSPSHKKYEELKVETDYQIKYNDFTAKVSFKIDGDKYVMAHYQKRVNVNAKIGASKDRNFEFVTDITVLDYKEGKFKLPNSKCYVKTNLFDNGNNYTEEFWKNQNIMLLSNEEEKIINDLNQKSMSKEQSTTE